MTIGKAADPEPLTPPEVRDLLALRPRILVVGDLILDCWLSGTSERMTREAPVPVVDVTKRTFAPGGAANTALNLAALGAEVRLVGIVGGDDEGQRLVAALQDGGVNVAHIVRSAGVSTTTKTRVTAGDHVIVRLDTATRSGLPLEVLAEEVRAWERATASAESEARDGAPWENALVVCDYDNGAVGGIVHAALVAGRSRTPLCVLDAHRVHDWVDLRADIITPNATETGLLIGLPLNQLDNRASVVLDHRAEILTASGAATAVVTLDRDGTVVLNGPDAAARTSAKPAHEWQASGAGDTFTAALTFARACGWDLERSAHLAQAAANVVLKQVGTGLCSAAALLDEVSSGGHHPVETKLLSHEDLFATLDIERASGRRIVFTNGCFDLLHRGHTSYLHQARQLGDLLVVAVNSDASARRLKGPGRPINPATDRAAVLVALGFVDYVTVFDDDTAIGLIKRIRPDIYAKGGDYNRGMLDEAPVVESSGGTVRILDYVSDHSTTDLVNRIRTPQDSEVHAPGVEAP
jgi:D-beta-D-heptose 7-phosphate kinase/D-beta-D-heptose 1-phosphate adenosyltransferase